MQKIVLVSRTASLISIFERATQGLGWLFEFYDTYGPYEADKVYWDIDLIRPEATEDFSKTIALLGNMEKSTHFLALMHNFAGIEKTPGEVERATAMIQSKPTPPSLDQELTSNYSLINAKHIENFLKIPKGAETLIKLQRITVSKFESDIPTIKSLLAEKKLKELSRITHRLKSTCGNAGYFRLHILCHWLELAGEYGQQELCKLMVNKLLDKTYSVSIKEWNNLGIV
jgi:HPt (histidine-containing phosphotransfer) domain-containing protein